MKICLSWLKEFVTADEPPARLAADLSMLGLPVDAVDAAGPDTVLELDITANRPDCLNHLGVARELAVLYREPLRPPRAELADPGLPAPAIEIQDPDLCARYCGLVITGVKVAPSPAWLQERLQRIGQRPINNIVDITNYVLLELGHPLHAFDLRKLKGGRIVVRRARPGESIETLDGRLRELEPEMLVIADREDAVAVAGVMGGAHSEVDDATTDILIESAWFLPASIRKTSRRLGLSTEASYRFERGADLQVPPLALRRAARLILELAGGSGVSAVTDAYPAPWQAPEIGLRARQVGRLIGVEIPPAFVADVLGRLGCDVRPADGGWTVRPPSHRPDLAIEADLIEELARFHGYNRLPSTLPLVDGNPVERRLAREKLAARRFLQEAGFQEIVTTSFTGEAKDGQFLFPAGGELLRLDNPLDEAEPFLRRGLLGGLVTALKLNENDYNAEAQLFELSAVYRRNGAADRGAAHAVRRRIRLLAALPLDRRGGALRLLPAQGRARGAASGGWAWTTGTCAPRTGSPSCSRARPRPSPGAGRTSAAWGSSTTWSPGSGNSSGRWSSPTCDFEALTSGAGRPLAFRPAAPVPLRGPRHFLSR